jgi:hypothetical protein
MPPNFPQPTVPLAWPLATHLRSQLTLPNAPCLSLSPLLPSPPLPPAPCSLSLLSPMQALSSRIPCLLSSIALHSLAVQLPLLPLSLQLSNPPALAHLFHPLFALSTRLSPAKTPVSAPNPLQQLSLTSGHNVCRIAPLCVLNSSNHKVNLLNNPDSCSHNPTESACVPTIFSNSIVTALTNAQRPMATKSSCPTKQSSKPHTWPCLACPICPPSTPGKHSSLHNSALISISQFCDNT